VKPVLTVAVLADSPTLTTGFATTTRHIAGALVEFGHRVTCFGIKARPTDIAGHDLPYDVWPAQRGGHWTDSLAEFFPTVRPDVLILNMDAYNALECITVIAEAGWDRPTVSYVCFDGTPVGSRYLEAQLSCASVWATSQTGASYLQANGIRVREVAPPGVDPAEFRPEPNRAGLRQRVGLAEATVVGVFATNTERKQVARAVAAFARVVARLPERDLRLYVHAQPNGHWNLPELAASLGIGDRLVLPSSGKHTEHLGVPTIGGELSYVDRINLCDVLVNVPHSGDVEQIIIEGQSCGIPLVHTDDEGVMAEAVGDAGVLVTARDVGIGRIGQRLHHVAPDDVADAVVDVLTDDSLRNKLIAAGLDNAARYSWDVLEKAAGAMVAAYQSPGSY
jgi:glycosyltransferase involved in cell wall biosynthesis